MRCVVFLLLCVLPLGAAESETDTERLERIKAEVERRRILREQAASTLEHAKKVVRDHESGVKKASDAELAAARNVIRKAESKPTQASDRAELHLPRADMETVRKAWQTLFGGAVSISDRAKAKIVSIETTSLPRDELREKMLAALRD